jgi:hypothetical protein
MGNRRWLLFSFPCSTSSSIGASSTSWNQESGTANIKSSIYTDHSVCPQMPLVQLLLRLPLLHRTAQSLLSFHYYYFLLELLLCSLSDRHGPAGLPSRLAHARPPHMDAAAHTERDVPDKAVPERAPGHVRVPAPLQQAVPMLAVRAGPARVARDGRQ